MMYRGPLFIATFFTSVIALMAFRPHIFQQYPRILPKRTDQIQTKQYQLIPSSKDPCPRKITTCSPHNQWSVVSLRATEKDLDDLISSILKEKSTSAQSSSKTDPYSRYTHQIAIPLASSSELTSALNSIQTSLVRDCPRLIRACVMPAMLRLPLLYVNARSASGSSDSVTGIFSTSNEIDSEIEQIVKDAIAKEVYNIDPMDLDGIGKLELPEPIMLPFKGLELQGEDNSVLYAVGYNINDVKKDEDFDEDGVYIVDDWGEKKASGHERLEQLVRVIQSELEKRGYQTFWPSDEPQGNEFFPGEDDTLKLLRAKTKKWRPRVPFVRLPSDFYDGLRAFQPEDENSGIDMDEIDAYFSKGFDGISPTFWYEAWAEEEILPSPGVRMRSVQVYRRMMSGGGESESSFYEIPSYSARAGDVSKANGAHAMDLPAGDKEQSAKEKKAKDKEMKRMGKIESEAEREWEEGKARMLAQDQADIDTSDDDYTEFHVSMEASDIVVEQDADYSSSCNEKGENTEVAGAISTANTESDRTMQDHDLPSEQSSRERSSPESNLKRKLPNIEDNPVFQRLWKGEAQVDARGESSAQVLNGDNEAKEVIPPYPSDEHFTGIWKVVQSPLGANFEDDHSPESSDNIVLRVDGQVMGGPVLDAKYQHKAAGGSWKMFQAVRRSINNDETSDAPITQTRLRIKLIIPPEKTQMLVMEGEVTRLGFGEVVPSSSSSAFLGNGGMLDGMSTAKLLNDNEVYNSESGEEALYCGGEAWIENTDGSGRRRKLGPFSLTKQKTVDRSKYIYTVPASRGGPEDSEYDSS